MQMTNNDVIRRLRYTFDLHDDEVVGIFALAEHNVTRAQVASWMKKQTDPDWQEMQDVELAIFLNGLIAARRGKREGKLLTPETSLNNNIIFRKLKIALSLRDEDIVEIFKHAGKKVSKHEVSALFRHPSQKQYRICQNQFLRNFLLGLQLKHRNSGGENDG